MLSLMRSLWEVFLHGFHRRETIQYPEEKPYLPPRYKGRIILTRDPDGGERCVACNLCAVACPVDCIALQATEDEQGWRYPEFFRINFSRCIFCGFCEEACPVDAIKLGPEYELADYTRESFVYTKEMLLEPEKYAPKRQLHTDVDVPRPGYTSGGKQLGELYGTYHPIASEDQRQP